MPAYVKDGLILGVEQPVLPFVQGNSKLCHKTVRVLGLEPGILKEIGKGRLLHYIVVKRRPADDVLAYAFHLHGGAGNLSPGAEAAGQLPGLVLQGRYLLPQFLLFFLTLVYLLLLLFQGGLHDVVHGLER